MENQIGKVIKARRLELGYSQEELAELVDRTPSHIGQIERGDSLPSVDILFKIVEVLSIDSRQFFSNPIDVDDIEDCVAMLRRIEPDRQAFLVDIIRLAYKQQYKRKC